LAQLIADRKDVDFVLHEQFKIAELSQMTGLRNSTKGCGYIVTEAGIWRSRRFCRPGKSVTGGLPA